jgi:hypothetical protein
MNRYKLFVKWPDNEPELVLEVDEEALDILKNNVKQKGFAEGRTTLPDRILNLSTTKSVRWERL